MKTYKCSCGKISSKNEMKLFFSVTKVEIPKHDYNDLTPSRFIEWEMKYRIIYNYKCLKCDRTLIEEKGNLF